MTHRRGGGDNGEPLLDTHQLAAHLGIAGKTLRHWRTTGNGPPYLKVGRAVRYRRTDVDTWLDTLRKGTR